MLSKDSKRLELINNSKYILYGGGFISDISLTRAVPINERRMCEILKVNSLREVLKDYGEEMPVFYKELVYLEQSIDRDKYLLHVFVFRPRVRIIVIKENLKL